jgi:vacuolar-type H+-ATPase subunit I/STV1
VAPQLAAAATALKAVNAGSEFLTGKSTQDLIAEGQSQLAFATGSFTGDVKQLVQDGASQLAQQINDELEAIGEELAGLSETEAFEEMRAGLEEAARKANEAVRKVEEDIASGKADTGKEQEKMDEERAALAEYEKQLRALQDRLSKQARGPMDTGVFEPDAPTTADRGQSLVDAAQFFNAIQAGGAVTPGERITHTKQDELINEIRGFRRDANINAGMPDLDATGVGLDADLEQ